MDIVGLLIIEIFEYALKAVIYGLRWCFSLLSKRNA